MTADINLKELASEVSSSEIIPPAVYNSTITGTGVDLQGYGSLLIQTHVGTIVDGDFVFEVQESDSLGSGYTAVDSDDLFGTGLTTDALKEPTFSSTNDDQVHTVAYRGVKRFVRVVITETGGSTGGPIGCIGIRGHARHQPAGATQVP
jgi:hypothetical protein